MYHTLIRNVLHFLLKLGGRIVPAGLENIPASGACIVTPNHLGTLDVPLLAIHIRRNDASLLAAKKYQENFIYRWMIDAVGGIWIDRHEADRKALRAARDVLRAGKILGVAPEGTRSPTRALIKGKPGAAYLASLADVLILPVGMTGPEKAFDELRRLRRPVLTIRFGKPYTLPPLDPKDREGSLLRNTDEIMCQIAALLPPSFHGVYADHPRLRELLQAQEGEFIGGQKQKDLIEEYKRA
jgi:1-acyl-sn-glycerol-3-phosphate acyltransferase